MRDHLFSPDVFWGEKLLFPTSTWPLCSHFLPILWSLSCATQVFFSGGEKCPLEVTVNYKSCYFSCLWSCPGTKRKAWMQKRWCPLYTVKQRILQRRSKFIISKFEKKRNTVPVTFTKVFSSGIFFPINAYGAAFFIIVNAGYFLTMSGLSGCKWLYVFWL